MNLPPPASASAGDSSGALAAIAKYDGGDQGFPKPSYQSPSAVGARRNTVTGTLGNAFSSAVEKTKDALTIEPKVVPAEDPLSLSNTPTQVGPSIYYASARLHESQGNFTKADELYKQALQAAPDDLDYLVHYARMHDRAGNLDRAGEIYRLAIAAHPREAAAYNDLGLCYARQDRWDESASSLEQAVRLQPESVLYRNNLATVLVEMGRSDQALTHLVAAHGEAVGHYNLGYLLSQRGDTQEAVPILQRALTVDPRLTPAATLLAQLTTATSQVAAAPVVASPTSTASEPPHRMPSPAHEAPAPRAGAPLPSTADSADGDHWGNAPTPDELPRLLPPVR